MCNSTTTPITKYNLIDIVCKWMDHHNVDPKYITTTYNTAFINGGYQTDLRAFINDILTSGMGYWEAMDKARK